jgi:hypothetical protein
LVLCNISINPNISNIILLAELVLYRDLTLMILEWGAVNAFVTGKGAIGAI